MILINGDDVVEGTEGAGTAGGTEAEAEAGGNAGAGVEDGALWVVVTVVAVVAEDRAVAPAPGPPAGARARLSAFCFKVEDNSLNMLFLELGLMAKYAKIIIN